MGYISGGAHGIDVQMRQLVDE